MGPRSRSMDDTGVLADLRPAGALTRVRRARSDRRGRRCGGRCDGRSACSGSDDGRAHGGVRRARCVGCRGRSRRRRIVADGLGRDSIHPRAAASLEASPCRRHQHRRRGGGRRPAARERLRRRWPLGIRPDGRRRLARSRRWRPLLVLLDLRAGSGPGLRRDRCPRHGLVDRRGWRAVSNRRNGRPLRAVGPLGVRQPGRGQLGRVYRVWRCGSHPHGRSVPPPSLNQRKRARLEGSAGAWVLRSKPMRLRCGGGRDRRGRGRRGRRALRLACPVGRRLRCSCS